jgi:DNA-binding NarL/FixJ family response regulator
VSKDDHLHAILLVDDHPIVRRGLRQLFEHEPDFTVCCEAEDLASALEAVAKHHPDLALVDLSLKGRSGLELTRQLQIHHPDLPVLILSLHDEKLYAERALQAGARGYVMKRRADADILHAARQVLAGHRYISPVVQTQLGGARSEAALEIDSLTDREFEVFLLIGQGYAPRHIAEQLSLSVSTVEVYRQHLKDKLHLNSAADLRRYAIAWFKDHESA